MAKTNSNASAKASVRRGSEPDVPVVPLRTFIDDFMATGRGEIKAPAIAGKDIYASAKAKEYWSEGKGSRAESLTSFSLLISQNQKLMNLIEAEAPATSAALAKSAGRSESNVSRSLSKLADIGVVVLREGAGRAKRPELVLREVRIKINLLDGSVELIDEPEVSEARPANAPIEKVSKGRKSPVLNR